MTIEQKLHAGNRQFSGKTILHTAPHHDDILLGYFPYVLANLVGNDTHVLYLTSGANGVSDLFCANYYGISLAAINQMSQAEKTDLKSLIREAESEKKWRLVAGQSILHSKNLRAEFYAVDTAHAMQKAMDRDITRILDYLISIAPDIIFVLVDEPGCGPATHHQSGHMMMQAIQAYQQFLQSQQIDTKITIIGYRNIWSTFTLEQTSMIVPVDARQLQQIEKIFIHCFPSQSHSLMISPNCNPYDLQSGVMNFAQQATSIMRQQGALVGMRAAIFLQQLS